MHVFPPRLNGETVAVARASVLLSRTLVTVDESSIEYRFEQTFFNDNEFRLQALFVLPLTTDDLEGKPEVTVNGRPAEFELIPADKFFTTLRQITIGMKDPSLLGLAGRTVLMVRPLFMDPRGRKSVRVQYRKRLFIGNDYLDVDVPLAGEQYSLGPVGELEVRVRFKMSRSVRTLFSPTHRLGVFRETPRRCLVTADTVEKSVREDFRLLATFSGEGLNLRVFPYKTSGGPGTFMAFVEPPVDPPTGDESDKNVVFLMDASGSLGKANLDFAKQLTVSGLQRLRPNDSFNVLIIGTSVKRLARHLIPASSENVTGAVRFVNAVTPAGGTDLCNGLIYALDEFSSRSRPNIVVMAGDGRGTVGTTKGRDVIDEVRRSNKNRARIFVLGLGARAEMATLDKIAVSTSGTSYHYSGTEDFPSVMNRFYGGVSPPRVSDLSLSVLGVATELVRPDPVPDLFGRESLVLFGRYRAEADTPCSIRLRGRAKGKIKTVKKSFTFPFTDRTRPYIEELWALREVGSLLDLQLLKGPKEDVTRRIQKFSERFGFSIPDTNPAASVRGASRKALDSAGLLWRFKTSYVAMEVESDRYRKVQGKTFHFDGTAWIDTEYAKGSPVRPVPFLSNRYFSIPARTPSLGAYLALGPNVTVMHGDEALQVFYDPSAVSAADGTP